jgi:glutathione synthase
MHQKTIAIQMDPIESIDIKKDSTFLLGLEAQNRGYQIFYYTPENLFYKDNIIWAAGHWIELNNEVGYHVKYIESATIDLSSLQIILLRQDPPFDMAYITSTFLLERIPASTLIVNNPTHVRNCPEKLFTLQFPELIPSSLISRNATEIRSFKEEHGDIILKPLYGNGGSHIYFSQKNDPNLNVIIEMQLSGHMEPIIAQKYIPAIKQGDKRIILVDGDPVGALNRIPQSGDHRANLHVGATYSGTILTQREQDICATLKPELQKCGLIFVGIDVIGDYLTEINVTSPTCLHEINAIDNTRLEEKIFDRIENKIG